MTSTRRRCRSRRPSRTTTRSSRSSPAGATAAARRRSPRSSPTPAPIRRGPRRRRSPPRSFTREVDTEWRRASYSSLSKVDVAVGPTGAVASEPEVGGKDDEDVEVGGRDGRRPPSSGDVPSPMAALPVGATFGSLVHAVLEHTDPDAPDLRAELLGHIDEQLGWWPVELDREELADALVAVCDSPLGPLVGATPPRGAADRPAARDGLRAPARRGRPRDRRHGRTAR